MSVRRLAKPAVQPSAFAFNDVNSEAAKVWIAKYPKGREQSAVIPLLMIAQDQEGWVSKPAIEAVADMLSMPYIRALEVATFYTQFQLKPVGSKAHIQVCGTTPCMLRGSEALMDVCRSKVHHDQFHLNASGTLSWEEVECLGACVNAPMIMVFKDTFEDLTPETLAGIIDAFEAGNGDSITRGPQTDRFFAAPATGFTTLTDEAAILKSTRDREAREAAANQNAEGGDVPPSNAAQPKTHAPETDPTLKTPAAEKPKPTAETPSPMPPFSAKEANKAAPAVEGVAKQREGAPPVAGAPGAYASPELAKADVAAPAGKKGASTEKKVASTADKSALVPTKPESVADPKPSLTDPNRPAGMDKPTVPDDLKLISGIGPKIEGILHSLGIYTFAQVAAWTPEQRAWVDGYLNFKGRIERDNWQKQADALAKGGVDEYIRVFGKKPV